MAEIMVSIVCNAYNHGKYIAQALESFVTQKTNFPFEVLVHDDASTDNTAQIILQYAQQYPDLVKPIVQTENQYSQHIPLTRQFQYSRAQGKYIAWCEGDDYWTDPEKLQKQVNAMEQHPEVDMCAHRTVPVRGRECGAPYPRITEDCVLSADQVIDGGGGFVSTNSLMFRKSFLDSPYDYTRMYNLDYIIQISGALRGGMLFLADVMAAYREFTPGSWTVAIKADPAKQRMHIERLRGVLEKIDSDTQHIHTRAISKCIWASRLKELARQGALKKIVSRENREGMKAQSFSLQMKILALACYKAIRKGNIKK